MLERKKKGKKDRRGQMERQIEIQIVRLIEENINKLGRKTCHCYSSLDRRKNKANGQIENQKLILNYNFKLKI